MKMLNPEYKDSQERFSYLHGIMIDAADAKAVDKYAELFVAASIDELLKTAEHGGSKLQQAAENYRNALKFKGLLETAIKRGEEKEESYTRLKGNRR